jgi:hypothetical protein
MEERYAVYFNCRGPPSQIPFAHGGASVPSSTAADWYFENAAITRSQLPGHNDIRTSGPRTISSATLIHALEGGPAHAIDSVSLSFRYLAGFDSGAGEWPVLALELVDAAQGTLLKTVYTSPPLDKYKFDSHMPYSPPIVAAASGLAVPNTDPVFVRLTIKNNDRNVQIPLDASLGLNVTVRWASPAPTPFTHAQFGTGAAAAAAAAADTEL